MPTPIRRRAVTAATSVMLLLSALVTTPLVHASGGDGPFDCSDFVGTTRFNGKWGVSTSQRYGVKAVIDPYHMYTCNFTAGGSFGSSSMWVGLEPQVGQPNANNGNALIQVGVVMCGSFAGGPCQGYPNYRYFVSYGGCGAAVASPHSIDTWVGGAPAGSPGDAHTYAITLVGSKWIISIDGKTFTDDQGRTGGIGVNDGAISCWSTEIRRPDYLAETADREDTIGYDDPVSNHQPSRISAARYQAAAGGSWLSPTWLDEVCNVNQPAFNDFPNANHCAIGGADAIDLWTVHAP